LAKRQVSILVLINIYRISRCISSSSENVWVMICPRYLSRNILQWITIKGEFRECYSHSFSFVSWFKYHTHRTLSKCNDLDEDKLFFDSESGLRVGRVAGDQSEQTFSLVEPLTQCGQLAIELHLVVGHRVETGLLGVAGRRARDGERHRLHAAARHRHRLRAGRRRRHDQLHSRVGDLQQTSIIARNSELSRINWTWICIACCHKVTKSPPMR